MQITMIGLPRTSGGGWVERGHTALLWRKIGWGVRVIATLPEEKFNPWIDRLRNAGCEVILDPDAIDSVSDSIVAAFCCKGAVSAWPKLKERGCRLIYASCMTIPLRYEATIWMKHPPSMVMFQSEYQKSRLWKTYKKWGARKHCLIHGAFEINDFPYHPRKRRARFVVGKLARVSRTKWPVDLWKVLGAARASVGKLEALCQGWDGPLEHMIGKPPEWARGLPEDTLPSFAFLSCCHALYCAGQHDTENWPRVGLEAMAQGVPIIADAKGGWLEMLTPETGILVNSPTECRDAIVALATDEPKRLAMTEAARKRVEKLANPEKIAKDWENAIRELG